MVAKVSLSQLMQAIMPLGEKTKISIPFVVRKDVSLLKKSYMLYSFFLVRRVIAPTAACILYNIILPVSVTIPELYLPVWGVAYIPTVLTIVTAIRHPK